MRILTRSLRLARDTRGISLVEFGLLMPIFLGTVIAALEMSQYVIATQRMQRVAANMGDLVAQSGTASIGASERQINDILSSMQYAARPFDLEGRGRLIITAVQGLKNPAAADAVQNRKLWHRCIGTMSSQANLIPGAVDSWIALPSGRTLTEGEILIHAQLAYEFEPLTGTAMTALWNPNAQMIKRTASFRPRSKTFVSITPDTTTARDDCPTA